MTTFSLKIALCFLVMVPLSSCLEHHDDINIPHAEIIVPSASTTPIAASLKQICSRNHAINYKAFGGPLPKSDKAILFATGLISSPTTAERVVAIAPDGSELFFTRLGDQGPHIYRSAYLNGTWQALELASFSVNNIATEPCISPDGKKLFFISASPENPSPDIWMCQRSNNAWGTPTKLGENVNTSGEEWHPSVSAKGDLYFASTKVGGRGHADIYFSKFENENYAMNENVMDINTAYNEWDPYISPDGKYIIFKSDRPGGSGGMDMYITLRKNSKWTPPQNLGSAAINTTANDDAGDVTPDGKYLIFARESPGVMDIYWISMDALKNFINQ